MKIEKVPKSTRKSEQYQHLIEKLYKKAKSIPRIYTTQYMHLVRTLK